MYSRRKSFSSQSLENLAHGQGQVSAILIQHGAHLFDESAALGSRVPGGKPRGRVVVLDITPLGAARAAGDEFFEMLGFKPNLSMMNPNVRYPSRVAQFAQGTGFYSEVRCAIFEG